MAALGGSRRTAGATCLPGGGRSRSCGSASFVACQGGLVSTGAGVPFRGKKSNGPMEKMTKEMYALALEEQIASRRALQPAEETLLAEPYLGAIGEDPVLAVERKLGQRHGGPMAPQTKHSYAKALYDQIALRDAHRYLQSQHPSEDSPADAQEATFGSVKKPQAKPVGKRCGAPLLPTKEAYAMALQDQIHTRAAQRAQEDSCIASGASADAAEETPAHRGRRHGGPMAPFAKDTYAVELQEQIATRNAQRASERAASLGPSEGHTFVFPEDHKARGRRHATLIEQPSRMSYMSALQEQMSEKAAQRAAGAYHAQVSEAPPPVLEETEDVQVKRYRGPRSFGTKQDYASELREQMEVRKAQEEEERAAKKGFSQLPSYLGGPEITMRGKRHGGQMQSLSKEGLSFILQEQIAQREAERSKFAFHNQVKCDTSPNATCLPGANADSLERFMSEHSVGVAAY